MFRVYLLLALRFFLIFHSFNSSIAFAQVTLETELWDRPLDELLNMTVVSGTRKENSSLQLPMVVTVLSGSDLSRWGAQNLAEALRFTAGMHIRLAPGDFPRYTAAVRGNTADFMNIRTLFLIDGVPVRNPNAGFDPGWIPISIIKRVEIVKGPASGIYGANAFGGLVNIITKNGPEEDSSRAEVDLGLNIHKDVLSGKEIPSTSAGIDFSQKKEAWTYFVSTQYANGQNADASAGGFQTQDVFGKFHHQVTDKASYSLRSLLSLDRNQLALSNTDTPMKNDFLHVAGTFSLSMGENSTLDVTGYLNNFNHFLKYNDALNEYENRGNMYGANAQLVTPLGPQQVLTSGLDIYEASGSLQTNENDYSTFPPTVKTAGWPSQKHNSYGIYAQYEYSRWNQYRPLIGFRYDRNSAFGDASSPRFGLSYLYSTQVTLYSSVGQGFRAPVFNETHLQGFGKVGNPNLNPEYTTTYEIGLKNIYDSTQNIFSIFKQDISKQINLVTIDPTNPSSLKTFKNSGTSSIWGLEIDGNYKLTSPFHLFYNATLLKSDDGSGKQIERLIERKFVMGAIWTVKNWKTELSAINESSQFFYNTNPSIPSDTEGRVFVPALTTLNIQVDFDFQSQKKLTLFFNNVLDQKYKEFFSPFINQDGLWLPGRSVGLRLNASF